jgi:hypothetical protein
MRITGGHDGGMMTGTDVSEKEAEKIVAVSVWQGAVFMSVKLKGMEVAEFVKVEDVRARWPQLLIDFYEAHLIWPSKDVEDADGVIEFACAGYQNRVGMFRLPDEILGAVKSSGHLFLVVRWEGLDRLGCIPAAMAHHELTDMLISFYESRIVWN